MFKHSKSSITLYEFNESAPPLGPLKRRTFWLPAMQEDLTIDSIHIASQAMTPICTGLDARCGSVTTRSIPPEH